jgi:hypothetical protein
MAALGALICFILALLGAKIGNLDLVVFGLVFVALHLLIGSWPFSGLPWRREV